MKKFISKEKLSKKARKELDSKKRITWGNVNPVTKKTENKKAYNRKKAQKEFNNSYEPFEISAFLWTHPLLLPKIISAFKLGLSITYSCPHNIPSLSYNEYK